MGLRKAYQAMIRGFNGGAAAMAGALGISEASLQNRMYEVKGQAIQVEMALAMQRLSGTTYFAEAIAEESGGTFVPLPAPNEEPDNEELLVKFLKLTKQFGELAQHHQRATDDGEVDDAEMAEQRRIGNLIHQTVEEINALTERIYTRVREPNPEIKQTRVRAA